MSREDDQRRWKERVKEAEAQLDELKRAKTPMSHTEFARRLGMSVQNFQTARGMRNVVRKLRRHNARCKSAQARRPDEPRFGGGGAMQELREQLRRVVAERESIRREAEERIRELTAKLDRFEAELEPTFFPLAAGGPQKPANDPFIEDEPDGACGVTVAGASRVLQIARMVPLSGLVIVRGRADGGRVEPRLLDASTPVLELVFEDLDEPAEGARAASEGDVLVALEFARGIRGHLLIHSWAGIGRAPAIALAVITDRLGPGKEPEALASVLSIERQAIPNRLVVEHADRILNRNGALVAALDARIRAHSDFRSRSARRERILARLASLIVMASPAAEPAIGPVPRRAMDLADPAPPQ